MGKDKGNEDCIDHTLRPEGEDGVFPISRMDFDIIKALKKIKIGGELGVIIDNWKVGDDNDTLHKMLEYNNNVLWTYKDLYSFKIKDIVSVTRNEKSLIINGSASSRNNLASYTMIFYTEKEAKRIFKELNEFL